MTLTGKKYTIILESSSSTINSLKQLFWDATGIHPDCQRLIYVGKSLEDGKLISDYNIQCNGTIHNVLRLRKISEYSHSID
jgi:hypothetical protein